MAVFVSPGVYTRELDFSQYAARVAGSVIALVGTAGKGPINEPQLLTSQAQLVEIFGRPLPTKDTRANFGLHAAYNALSQTPQVWYTRVADGSERLATTSAPIVINNQIIWEATDDDGITVTDGSLAFVLEVTKVGTALKADTFNALARKFGSKNLFDGSYNPITSLSELETAISGSGAFAQIIVPMGRETTTFENVEQWTSRFNDLMLGQPLRSEFRVIEDDVSGVFKFWVVKTQNLSDLVQQNLQFQITDSSVSPFVSPNSDGKASGTYEGNPVDSPASTDDIHFKAKQPGLLGNAIVIDFVDVGNTFDGLPPVSVSGKTITVSINATAGTGTTTAEIIDALDDSSSARLLIDFELDPDNDGTAIMQAETINLSGGGSNLPAELGIPTIGGGTNLSATKTQVYNPASLTFRFEAASPGEYANAAAMSFDKDSTGLNAIQYQEGNETPEGATELTIQPAGSRGSFIDFISGGGIPSLGPFSPDDYTMLTDAASLALGDGGINVLSNYADDNEWLQWNSYEFYEVTSYPFSGGRSGIPDDYNDLIDEVIGNAADETGVYSFQNRELFDNSLLAVPGFDQAPVIRAGFGLCERTGDMFYIADTPGGVNLELGLTVQQIVDWHNGRGFGNSSAFNTSYAATYHSWQEIFDEFNAVNHWVPPSVLVLEQIAFSDNVGEVWFAPAGFKRGRLLRALNNQRGGRNSQGERDYMYSNGNAINPIVNFPKDGVVIFGQRTLQRTPSALDRINVRRLLIYVKRVSAAAVKSELFEPNDAILWGVLTRILTPIFTEVQAKRGINRFLIKIDEQTTTTIARENNEVIGYILIEPTKAAEKIILNFVITAQGANFGEALAQAGVV